MTGDEAFLAFVTPRMDRWRRCAYLVCQEWHTADDAVSEAVAKLYRAWARVRRADNADAYAQRVLTRCCLDELRRPWRSRERLLVAQPPTEPIVHPAGTDLVDERQALAGLLASLGPRQRAVLVVRFYLGHSVEETARLLGISESTVRSQGARALATVRGLAASSSTPSSRRTP